MKIIVCGLLMVVTAAGCLDGPSLLNGKRPPQDPPRPSAPIAPPPVTAEQVSAANAAATVQALQAEMDRDAAGGGAPAARNPAAASH